MFRFAFLLFTFSLFFACQQAEDQQEQSPPEDNRPIAVQRLDQLSSYMQGSFTSEAQAAEDTAFMDISLEMQRIWPEADAGIWLYVEQAATATKGKPYRQRVYQLQILNDSTFSSTVYELPKAQRFVGAYAQPARLDSLRPDSLNLLTGCDLRLSYQNDTFAGKTGDRSCRNAWGDAAYATSEVTITKDQLISWDRGYDAEGNQVWGAEKGGYVFEKR
jgi:CpeT protein